MSLVHLHLLLNHIPVFATVFGMILLGTGLLFRNHTLKLAGLSFFVSAALFAVPVYFTGEPSEKAVHGIAGVSQPILEQHEDLAKVSFLALLALGGLSAIVLALSRKSPSVPQPFVVTITAASILVCGLMIVTANLGGQVRHSEIRMANAGPVAEVQTDSRSHHGDDD